MFAAYGDFNHFPRKVREGCQRTGVNLIDVPNGKKDASDKAIFVDMFLFALDNPPPCTIFLISGDVDFASALHKLGLRGYTIVLAIPSGVGVASALISAGKYVWDWPSVARGNGLVPAKAFQAGKYLCAGNEIHGCAARQSSGWIAVDDSDQPKHEFALPDSSQRNILKKAIINGSNSYSPRNDQPAATQLRSLEKSFIDGVLGGDEHQEQNEGVEPTKPRVSFQTSKVKPRDLGVLKRQLVRLVSMKGGKVKLDRIGAQYNNTFGRPLIMDEYEPSKLVRVIKSMPETFFIEGKCTRKILHLTKAGMEFASKCKGSCISSPDSNFISADKKDGDRDEREKEVTGFKIQPTRGKKRLLALKSS
ncbi:hypothetical protein O6H91_04G082000 [Diphasiastrum complanatum]|nr:hypothetical protein O6H91_04G082000 [Diphasiastrum complanatum]